MGMTQREFGEFCGFTQQVVSKWERGTMSPNFSSIQTISNKCGASVAWLTAETDDKLEKSNNKRKFKEAFRDIDFLTNEECGMILRAIVSYANGKEFQCDMDRFMQCVLRNAIDCFFDVGEVK